MKMQTKNYIKDVYHSFIVTILKVGNNFLITGDDKLELLV